MNAPANTPSDELDRPAGDESSDDARATRPNLPRGGPDEAGKQALRVTLLAMRDQLARTGKDLVSETLKKSGQTFKIDHMADAGSDNADQAVNLSLLEGEVELMDLIEAAIHKIDGQVASPYGLCEACAQAGGDWDEETTAPWIPLGRLEALPYARLCVMHQEEEEEEG